MGQELDKLGYYYAPAGLGTHLYDIAANRVKRVVVARCPELPGHWQLETHQSPRFDLARKRELQPQRTDVDGLSGLLPAVIERDYKRQTQWNSFHPSSFAAGG